MLSDAEMLPLSVIATTLKPKPVFELPGHRLISLMTQHAARDIAVWSP